jgi:hypothetical protein
LVTVDDGKENNEDDVVKSLSEIEDLVRRFKVL